MNLIVTLLQELVEIVGALRNVLGLIGLIAITVNSVATSMPSSSNMPMTESNTMSSSMMMTNMSPKQASNMT